MPLYNQFTDGDFTTATARSHPRFSQPFEGDNGEYIIEQDFEVDKDYFQALPLNTAHNDGIKPYKDYILVKEGPLSNAGPSIVSWTRTYAMLPATRNDPSTTTYTFIGFLGNLFPITFVGNPTIPPGRNPFSQVVKCRVQNDYFLLGPDQYNNTLYTSLNDIPLIQKTQYYLGPGYWTAGPTWVPLYSDPVRQASHGLPLTAIWDISGSLAISGPGVAPTPTRTQYETWMTNKTEIVAETSTLSRWQGNIIQRQTKYIVAI